MTKPQLSNLPPPFQFNAWKHHLSFLQDQLRQIKRPDYLQKKMLAMGTSVMDVYTGNLPLPEIQESITHHLQHQQSYQYNDFLKWLRPEGYKIIQLPDRSRWTLRQGEIPEYYIHLHPARYSPHSFRVKANLWKTALTMVQKNSSLDLNEVNLIRKNLLHLSPIKSIEPGLVTLVKLLGQN